MSSVDVPALTSLRYLVFEASAFGVVRQAAVIEAVSDKDAMRQARQILPNGPGELRQGNRVICRFGRSDGLMLRY
jgi:hypothetical protein